MFCVRLRFADLKTSLSSFIEKETTVDYDREAELALQRLTTGEVDVNQLTGAWSKSYAEVKTQFIQFFLKLLLAIAQIYTFTPIAIKKALL